MERQPIHTTEQELNFLSRLQPKIVEKYLAAMPLRKRWEPLDPGRIMDHCKKIISQHKAKQDARSHGTIVVTIP